ncbi:ABC transporter permease [Chelativorans sp. Marseille-P2723]|uniref:ABC transporter permease n=1 Tax=Chelativorans sp. Marseille-P2723 TaxID=2709133 RepID=UPI0015709636|nr:ABC transporter permease [Chelativorans sp. Marseille-P2723]
MNSPEFEKNRWRWIERSFKDDLAALLNQRSLAWHLYLAQVAELRKNSGLGLIAPFASVLVHVLVLGSVMGLVFQEPLDKFLPYFAISFSLWQGLAIYVSQSAQANEKISRYIPFPNISGYMVHLVNAYEYVVTIIMKFAAACIIILAVNPTVLLNAEYMGFFVGIVLISAVLFCWSLPISFFFDKIRLLRAFLPQFLFAVYLLTPILWYADRLKEHQWVADFNPVFHLIELARAPIITGTWPVASYFVALGLIVLGVLLSFLVYPANRALVVYRWVA